MLNMVNEAVDRLLNGYNYKRGEHKYLQPYIRFTVEKYIFERLFNSLYEMYKFKNKSNA